MKITRLRSEIGRQEAEAYERKLIVNEIIKNGDSFQRYNNSNYDSASAIIPHIRFRREHLRARVTLPPLLLLRIDSYEFPQISVRVGISLSACRLH